MIESIFSNHLNFILSICILSSILYLYNCNKQTVKEDFFIPDVPSMSEYYIKKIKEIEKPRMKYFMTIPYGDNLVSKNNLWNMVRECKESKKFLPKSFILENFYDSINLKDTFDKEKVYILKKNIHRKTGLKLFKGTYNDLVNEYKDGGFKVIQEFIPNPYLINNRVFVIRMYLLLKKEDDLYEYYIHNYSKCLFASKEFSFEGLEEDRLITNSRHITDEKYPKDMKDLEKYNITMDILKKPIINVVNCFKKFISNLEDDKDQLQLTFFQLFGVDIILDEKLNPYLLEINKNPDMDSIYYDYDKKMKEKVVLDVKNLVKSNIETNFIKF